MNGSLLGPSLVSGFRTATAHLPPAKATEPSDPDAAGPASSGTRPPTLPILDRPATYVCPGDTHPISRAVHLARLAAFYPKCRTCEHRRDSGQIANSTTNLLELTSQRAQTGPLFRDKGVRGVYLNQLTRHVVGQMGAAFASVLWESRTLSGPHESILRTSPSLREGRTRGTSGWGGAGGASGAELMGGRVDKLMNGLRESLGTIDAAPSPDSLRSPRGPCIVIAHDARTSSPDLTVGLAAALRRMECDVVDIGRASRPCLDFAVQHLHADGGVHVGGQGCPPAWNGLEFVGSGGEPWCRPGKLDRVAERFESGTVRPTRRAGRQRYFDITTPYRASFWKHVHDLTAAKIVVYCSEPVIEATLSAIFSEVLVELIPIDSAMSSGRRWIEAAMVTTIRQSRSDLGVLIDPDGRRCQFWDEEGSPLDDRAVLRAIVTSAGASSRQEIIHGGDAILTLLYVLQTLPRADQPTVM